MRADRRAFIAIPVLVAIVTVIWPPNTVGSILDGTAILTALLFGLLVHVFTLGLSASKEDLLQGSWVLQLIDELRINTAYAISVGILAVIFLSAAGAYGDGSAWATTPLSSIGIGLVVHLLMTLGMILKRTNTAYVEMRKRTRPHYR